MVAPAPYPNDTDIEQNRRDSDATAVTPEGANGLQPTSKKDSSPLSKFEKEGTVHVDQVKSADNGFGGGEGGSNFRTLGRFQTAIIFITNEVGIGILSLPKTMQTLGLVPGLICIIGLGVLTTYTAYVLLQFQRRYPHCLNIVDCCRVIGGRPMEIVGACAFILNLCLTCASACLTMSIGFNTMTDNAICTVAFVAIPIIFCWLICIPRSLAFVSHVGIPSTILIVAAVVVVVVAIGVGRPQGAPNPFEKEIKIVGNPTFVEGLNAVLSQSFAYAGNRFVTVMAEMRDPSRDFVPALISLQLFAVSLYALTGAIIYGLAGQFTSSPALGTAPQTAAQIAYGLAFVPLIATGLVFGHTAIKYLWVIVMRRLGAQGELTKNTTKSWGVWVGIGTLFWIVAFILANAIPVFSSILNVSSAVFVAWWTFGISGLMWIFINWGQQFSTRRRTTLAILNWAILAMALFYNTVGMYTSIEGLLATFNDPESAVDSPFTCASNAIF